MAWSTISAASRLATSRSSFDLLPCAPLLAQLVHLALGLLAEGVGALPRLLQDALHALAEGVECGGWAVRVSLS